MTGLPATGTAAERLAERRPRETQKMLTELLERSHGVALAVRSGLNGPTVEVRLVPGMKPNLEAARKVVRASMSTCTEDQAETWLAEMCLITPTKQKDEITMDLWTTAMVKRVVQYPADIVREALTVRRWKFVPSWDELATVLDDLVAPRIIALNRIEAAIKAPPEPPPPRPTELERRRAQKAVDEYMRRVPTNRSSEGAARGEQERKAIEAAKRPAHHLNDEQKAELDRLRDHMAGGE